MIYAIAAFALSLAAVLGAYWAFIVRPEATEKAQLSGRLKTFKVKSSNISIEAAPDRVSALPFLEGLPESLVNEKLLQLGIPPEELESDLKNVRKMVPGPLRDLAGRVPGGLDRLAEMMGQSGAYSRVTKNVTPRDETEGSNA